MIAKVRDRESRRDTWFENRLVCENDLFDPCDPYMTFEVKLLITFVATHPLVILTKFGQNPIKHVEEETNCEKKKEEEEERNRKKEIS